MRIWIFNHYAAPPDASAGTRHFDLGRELVRFGHDVTIFAAGFRHSTFREERLRGREYTRAEVIDGVRFVWLRTVPYSGNSMARALNMLSYSLGVLVVQARERRPAVIVGSTVHPLAALSGLIAARLRGARFFFEVRDLWPQSLVDMGAMPDRSLAVRLLRRLEELLLRSSSRVITLLEASHGYMVSRGASPTKIVYIPNGVVLRPARASAEPDAPHTRETLWPDGPRFVAAYVGTMGRANGVVTLIQAGEELARRRRSDIGLMLVGGGPERDSMAALVASKRLPNVRVLGPVPKFDVPSLLTSADAGVLHLAASPVYRYGVSPNKLFDYLAASLPVVFAVDALSTSILECPAISRVPPDDPVALAAALENLADMSYEARQALGRAGRQYVEVNHEIGMLARRLDSVLTYIAE